METDAEKNARLEILPDSQQVIDTFEAAWKKDVYGIGDPEKPPEKMCIDYLLSYIIQIFDYYFGLFLDKKKPARSYILQVFTGLGERI